MENSDVNWIKGLAINEVLKKKFNESQKYLKLNSIPLVNGIPKISRIDTDKKDGSVIVYFPIENESYYFAVGIKTLPDVFVEWVSIEAGNSVVLTVTSEKYTLKDILNCIAFEPTEKWDIGDNISFTGNKSKTSGFIFDPISERADECVDNIVKLLDVLELESDSILKLSTIVTPILQIHWYGYLSNLSSIHLDKQTIERIANLRLSIDFNLNVSGNRL